MEDHRRVVRLLPAFGQIGLNDEGARRHPRTDLMAHKPTVSEAQRRIRLKVDGEMVVKVDRIIPAHAQDAPALGLPRFRPPEHVGTMQRPSRQRGASGETRFQQVAPAHAWDIAEMSTSWFHKSPSCMARVMVDGSSRAGSARSGAYSAFGMGRMLCNTYGDVKKIIARREVCLSRLFTAKKSWQYSII